MILFCFTFFLYHGPDNYWNHEGHEEKHGVNLLTPRTTHPEPIYFVNGSIKSRKNLPKFNVNFNINAMRKNLLIMLFTIGLIPGAFAQLPQDVYKKPLKEVLSDIEKKSRREIENI